MAELYSVFFLFFFKKTYLCGFIAWRELNMRGCRSNRFHVFTPLTFPSYSDVNLVQYLNKLFENARWETLSPYCSVSASFECPYPRVVTLLFIFHYIEKIIRQYHI